MLGRRLYIFLMSHLSLCRLLSNFNFELLMSVMYVYLCALVRAIESLQKMNETRDMCSFCGMPPRLQLRESSKASIFNYIVWLKGPFT
jgi:hypothetical protein